MNISESGMEDLGDMPDSPTCEMNYLAFAFEAAMYLF